MPRQEMDYTRTIIYKIVCNDISVTECYVGHTTNFIKRKNHHKSDCNNEKSNNYNSYVYQFIRANGSWENWDMVQIEEFSCENRLQACARERYWIETLKAELNSCIPNRSKKEYKQSNKDVITKQKKLYYETKREEILENKKRYYEANKDEIAEYQKQYQKQYYETNKDKICQVRLQKIECNICNCQIIKSGKARHEQTKRHQYILNKSQPISKNKSINLANLLV